jgi:hypothetical protein
VDARYDVVRVDMHMWSAAHSLVVSSFSFRCSTAKHMIHSAFTTHPSFLVYFNFEAWMLTNLTAGMSPVTTLKDALSQVALGGLFRFISLFYLNDWWRMFRNIHAAKRTLQETEAAALAQGKTEKKD